MSAAIEVEGLVKRYRRALGVDGVSFEIPEGESFGYLGPNGAGKTTTIRCMLGLINLTEGKIRLFGLDAEHNRREILARIGYLPGELGLWPQATGREVLEYLGRLLPSPVRRDELCERLDLSRADLERQVRTYSRGMKQKIGIVQALQHAPPLLILDEPTEGLDPVMQDRFIQLVQDHRKQGGTVFLSSHILNEVEETTDRVAVLRAGKVVKIGLPTDLTGEKVRHFTVVLKQDGALDALTSVPGVSDMDVSDRHVRFDYRGDAEPIIDALRALHVADILVQPESLAESFFEVYGE
ncbi:MAG: ABC transporter ATP-binding protein [Actinomycetota bacterium]